MQNQYIIDKDGKLATPSYTQQPKRKAVELSPENMEPIAETSKLPGNLDISSIVSIIHSSIQSVLDEKLKTLSTKDDIEEVKETMKDCCSQIGHLKLENEALREEVKELKVERDKDHKDLMRLVDKSKRKNVVFRGIDKEGVLKNNIKKVCVDKMGISDVVLKDVRRLYEAKDKVCAVVEFQTEEMADSIFKNTSKLKGTSIFVDKDLNVDKQQNKKVMLQLKKLLKSLDQNQKILVRNDKMKINNLWFFWNKDKILMCDNKNGQDILKTIYNEKIDSVNLSYNYLLNQKN